MTLSIFLFILFIYIYIIDQYKTGDDLEIYEIDYRNNHHLQEACDVHQPILFYIDHLVPRFFQDLSLENMAKFGSYDLSLKNVDDYYQPDACLDPLPLPFYQTIRTIEMDKSSHYFSENNREFLEETGLYKSFQHLDDLFKPSFHLYSKYDITTGSVNTVSPLRFHKYYRQFMCVVSGKIHIRMAPWKNTQYLYYSKGDYEYYEFRSPVHSTHPKPEHSKNFDKIHFLQFDVLPGQSLYIPPYWWYSIEYMESNTFVGTVSYSTWMNTLANMPDLALYWLQQQNITKKVKISTVSNDTNDTNDTNVLDEEIQLDIKNVEYKKELTEEKEEVENIQEESDPISIVIQEIETIDEL